MLANLWETCASLVTYADELDKGATMHRSMLRTFVEVGGPCHAIEACAQVLEDSAQKMGERAAAFMVVAQLAKRCSRGEVVAEEVERAAQMIVGDNDLRNAALALASACAGRDAAVTEDLFDVIEFASRFDAKWEPPVRDSQYADVLLRYRR